MFGPHRVKIRRYLFQNVLFSLKSSLPSHLNHSIQILNDQVMAKILTLVQNRMTGHLWYRYHSVWYRYHPLKMPRNGGFSPIFPYFSTQTNSIINIHIKTTLYPSCNLYSTQFIFQYISFFKNLSCITPKTTLIWVITHTQTKHKDLLGFILTQTPLLCN